MSARPTTEILAIEMVMLDTAIEQAVRRLDWAEAAALAEVRDDVQERRSRLLRKQRGLSTQRVASVEVA